MQDESATRRVSIFSEQQTYSVPNKEKRSASFDNTDYEMTYISDLPYEKEGECETTYRLEDICVQSLVLQYLALNMFRVQWD